jgi:hypothetical protein
MSADVRFIGGENSTRAQRVIVREETGERKTFCGLKDVVVFQAARGIAGLLQFEWDYDKAARPAGRKERKKNYGKNNQNDA